VKCPHCGQEHQNQATYCPVTGDQIIAFECPNCTQVVMAATAFCPYCGFNLVDPPGPAVRRGPLLFVAAGAVLLALIFLALILLPRLLNFSSAGTSPLSSASPPARLSQTPGTPAPGGIGSAISQTLTVEAGLKPNPISSLTPSLTPSNILGAPPACTATGQTWLRPLDAMQMVCVPTGIFIIGMKTCVFVGCGKEVNGGTVNLDAFWIDQTEVTNAMFSLFVAQTGYITGAERNGAAEVNGNPNPVPGADWRHPQGTASSIIGLDNHPVVQMSWYSSSAYCKWAGGSLPTEAQWENAARDGDGRLFPWGNDLPKANLLNAADSSLPVSWAQKDQNDGYRYTSPVGSYPDGNSPYGVEDMAGNAWEWTRSIYKDYPYNPGDGREIQTAPTPGDKVTIRGGGFYDDYGSVRSTLRYGGMPDLSHDATGFRCVYP
jgi:formylglycine-generating enzyme required for sulfatase activity